MAETLDLAFRKFVSETATDTNQHCQHKVETSDLFVSQILNCCNFLFSKLVRTKVVIFPQHADLKPVEIYEYIRYPCHRNGTVHQAVKAGNWDSNHLIGEFQSATVSLSEFQAQFQTIIFRDPCFGNYILKGCVLKLSFHLL